MGVCYEILRPADENDLKAAGPRIAAVLKRLPPTGYVSDGDRRKYGAAARRAFEWACANGVMRKSGLSGRVMKFESVRFWASQLSPPKTRNVAVNKGTRYSYVAALDAFNSWLRGKKFPVREEAVQDGRVVTLSASRSFASVEDLLRFCEGSDRGGAAARRVLRQYLADSATSGRSLSTALVHCAAIKSYFAVHDITADVQVAKNHHRASRARESPRMSLLDLYKMMTAGRMDVMMKAIVMIKFQAGLDSSTLADRFNFDGYGQVVRHFGTGDYDLWDLDKCPVPVRMVRVKTGMQYTTFLDRDSVSHLQDYLRWRESKFGSPEEDGPLFVTQRRTPVRPEWISAKFSRAATNAGIQRRVSRGTFMVQAHEVRDLLKSTLIVAGCAPYAADHVLGHAPRDSYEKQAVLYPEALRREYAKASEMLNPFTGIERYLKAVGGGTADPLEPRGTGPEPEDDSYRVIEQRQRETQAAVQRIADTVAGMLRMMMLDKEGSPDSSREVRQMINDLGWSGHSGLGAAGGPAHRR